MMSLVAYDNSSGSETEENEVIEESGGKVKLNGTSSSVNVASGVPASLNPSPTAPGELFMHLPQPQTRTNMVEEEQDEFLKKKEQPAEKPGKVKQPVKIGILSLSEFSSDDEDDEPARKKAKQVKASGLFAILPAPKVTPISTTSFVPNVVKRKTNPPSGKSTKISQQKTKPPEPAKPSNTAGKSLQIDDDDDIEVPETFDDETWQKVCGKQQRTAKPAVQEDTSTVCQDISYVVEAAPDVEKPYEGLDNQAFKELVGSRKKMKENIEIIDIHEDEIRPDREEWLKSLTDPNFEPQTDVKNPVNNTCKVKNHITALAQKALANDKELQMRWAESRHNRRQTQAKYGF